MLYHAWLKESHDTISSVNIFIWTLFFDKYFNAIIPPKKKKLNSTSLVLSNRIMSQAPVAHPSYSGSESRRTSAQGQYGQKKKKQNPISKICNTKRAGGVAQGVGPEFKPQYCKNK
jgi:hypothetical protein